MEEEQNVAQVADWLGHITVDFDLTEDGMWFIMGSTITLLQEDPIEFQGSCTP